MITTIKLLQSAMDVLLSEGYTTLSGQINEEINRLSDIIAEHDFLMTKTTSQASIIPNGCAQAYVAQIPLAEEIREIIVEWVTQKDMIEEAVHRILLVINENR